MRGSDQVTASGAAAERQRATWRPRWYELVPEAIVALGLTAFLIDETDAAISALRSGKAIALTLAAGAVWVVARLAAARFLRPVLLRLAVFGAGGAVVLAAVVLPAYNEDTVVETLTPSASSGAPAPAGAGTPTVDGPGAGGAAVAPQRIASGTFRGIDHRARGTVALYRQPDGRHVVGLEDFDIQPGPDYDLYVVPGADRDDLDGGIRLGDLRGNRGTQYYPVPAGTDVGSGTWTVLVWCQRFAVPIANATPR